MSVIFTKITSLEDFDYNAMFNASFPTIDGNFLWPPMITTYEDKREYYKAQLLTAIDSTWPLKGADETLFMYTGVYDGVMMEFVAGFTNKTNTFRGHWYLTAPDANGSKNAIHIESTHTVRAAFYNENNIASYKVPTFTGSAFYKWIKLRASSGALTIISENLTFPDSPGMEAYITLTLAI